MTPGDGGMVASLIPTIIVVVGTGVAVATFLYRVLRSLRNDLSGEISALRTDVAGVRGGLTDVRERVAAVEARVHMLGQLVMRPAEE